MDRNRLRRHVSVGMLIVLATGTVGHAAFGDGELTYVDSITVTGTYVDTIGGLTYHGGALYAGDIYIEAVGGYGFDGYGEPLGGSDQVIVHEIDPTTGDVEETYWVPDAVAPYQRPTGAAAANVGRGFLTCFSEATGVADIDALEDEVWTVSQFLDYQGTEGELRAKGLAWDGRYVWQAHYSPDDGHLYAIDPTTGDRVNDLAVDPYPRGLTYDGRYFWVGHDNVMGGFTYIAKYDKAGNQLGSYDTPEQAAESSLGDLAWAGGDLFAIERDTNAIHRMTAPAAGSGPDLPSGVLATSIATRASIDYAGTPRIDTQTAANYDLLPCASSMRRTAMGSEIDVRGKARCYYDEAGEVHHRVHALAYGDAHEQALTGIGRLIVSKQLRIEPTCCLPAGTPVYAKGTLRLTGTFQACRAAEVLPSASGAKATLSVNISKRTAGGGALSCFSGQVGLWGVDDSADPGALWTRGALVGDLNTPEMIAAAAAGLVRDDTFAYLELCGEEIVFRVPVLIGEAFDVDIVLSAWTYVSEGAEGVGFEACFGETPILYDGFAPTFDPVEYGDGYDGDIAVEMFTAVPEPGCGLLLAAGVLPALRRSRRRRRRG